MGDGVKLTKHLSARATARARSLRQGPGQAPSRGEHERGGGTRPSTSPTPADASRKKGPETDPGFRAPAAAGAPPFSRRARERPAIKRGPLGPPPLSRARAGGRGHKGPKRANEAGPHRSTKAEGGAGPRGLTRGPGQAAPSPKRRKPSDGPNPDNTQLTRGGPARRASRTRRGAGPRGLDPRDPRHDAPQAAVWHAEDYHSASGMAARLPQVTTNRGPPVPAETSS